MEQIKRKQMHWLFGVLICALVLRICLGLSFTDLNQASDELHWDGMGWSLARLGVMHSEVGFYRPPLYGLMLAGVYQVFGHSVEMVRVLQALIGTATCFLVYCLGVMIGGRLTGLLAAAVCAVYPMFVFFSGVLMAETLLVFLTTVCVLAYLKFDAYPTYGYGAGLGLCVGLSALCKPVLALWVPLVLILWMYQSELKLKKKIIFVGLIVVSCAVVILPWTWRNYVLSGELIPISTNVGMNLLIGWHPDSIGVYENELDYFGMYQSLTGTSLFMVGDPHMFQIVMGWFFNDPLHSIFLFFAKVFWFWVPWVYDASLPINIVALLSSGPLLFFGIWGLVNLRHKQMGLVLVLFVICVSILHVIFFAHTRFRLPIDAVLCVTAAWFMTSRMSFKRGCDGH